MSDGLSAVYAMRRFLNSLLFNLLRAGRFIACCPRAASKIVLRAHVRIAVLVLRVYLRHIGVRF